MGMPSAAGNVNQPSVVTFRTLQPATGSPLHLWQAMNVHASNHPSCVSPRAETS